MIATLHQIKVASPAMPSSMFSNVGGDGRSIMFGDIILNVEQLADDMDVRNMVDRVMEEIEDRMSQGMAVGGIRVTR